MFSYVARQAILDREKNLFSYELLFRDGEQNCFPDISPDEATSRILTNNHLDIGLQELTEGKLAFINFHEETLLHRFPTSLDPKSVVIEILETVNVTEQLVKACIGLKKKGYKLALDDFTFAPCWDVLLPYTDLVKVDIVECNQTVMRESIAKLKRKNIKLVAEKIETYQDFEEYKNLGFDYFQGYFFARPEIVKQKSIPTSKLPLLELVSLASVAEFDFARVNQIIERDVSLSYKLLRFINNPAINKSKEISSLRHALTYMGELEVKKFIALLALANLGQNKTIELIYLSLIRAKFCDLVAQVKNMTSNPPNGFILGLFSLLDAFLDISMLKIVEQLPIGNEMKQALCGEENALSAHLALINAFEKNDWEGVAHYSHTLNLDLAVTQQFYYEALQWGRSMKVVLSA